MSLTSFLQNKDVRAMFSQEFYKPKFNLRKGILAPPITNHYGLVGTAFDYLMRFYTERLNPQAISGKWIAESAVNQMSVTKQMSGSGLADFQDSAFDITPDLIKKGKEVVTNARTAYTEYLKSGVINDELLTSTLLMAQLDTYYRAGIVNENLGKVDKGDLEDLRQLYSIVNPDFFRAKALCMLNPTFGEASYLVGGADADILIDNILIDIKTTKNLEFKREDFNQLVGYYLLFRIGSIDDAPCELKIDRLGIYFSRYAELQSFPVNTVIDEDKIPRFIDWFKKRANEIFSPSY